MILRILVIDDKLGRSPSHRRQLKAAFAALVGDCNSERGKQFDFEVEFCSAQRFDSNCWFNDIDVALAAINRPSLALAKEEAVVTDWTLVLVDMQFDHGPVEDESEDPPIVAPHFGLEIETALLSRYPSLPLVRFTSSHERDLKSGIARPFLSKLDVFGDTRLGLDALRIALVKYGRLIPDSKAWLLKIPSATPVASATLLNIYIGAYVAAQAGELVLLRGEAGTGKEVLARYMHSVSPRAPGSFVGRSLASVPSELFEAELFGVEKGAATGIGRQLVGEFEHAAGGTLLLDELGAASSAHQAKLLRVLQERRFARVGGREVLEVRCNVLAATQDNIEARCRIGEFRQDLYDRFQRVLYIPSLRERPEDIEPLARQVLADELSRTGKVGIEIADDALMALKTSPLPKNARTVQQVLARAVSAKSSRSVIRAADLLFDPTVPDTERSTPVTRGTGAEETMPPTLESGKRVEPTYKQRAIAPQPEGLNKDADARTVERGSLKRLQDHMARRERQLARQALERCRHPVTGKLKILPAMQYLMDDADMTPMAAKRLLQKLMGVTQRDEYSAERVEQWLRTTEQDD